MPLAMAKKCELVWANKHTQCETAMATSLSPSVWLTPPSQKAIYLAAPQLSFSLSVTHSLSLSHFLPLIAAEKYFCYGYAASFSMHIPCVFFRSSLRLLSPRFPWAIRKLFPFSLPFLSLSLSIFLIFILFSYEKLPGRKSFGAVVKRWNYGKLL